MTAAVDVCSWATLSGNPASKITWNPPDHPWGGWGGGVIGRVPSRYGGTRTFALLVATTYFEWMSFLAVGISFLALTVALAGAGWGFVRSERLASRVETAPRELFDITPIEERLAAQDASAEETRALLEELRTDGLSALVTRADVVDRRLNEMLQALAEGIERVDRSERRIRATVTRAQKKLEEAGFEDAGVEAEAAGLQLVDVGGSEDVAMRVVQEDVETDADRPSSIPGVSAETLAKARGYA